MKFGIFYEHHRACPWTATCEYDLFQRSLAQFELADRLGHDHVWEVEHHLLRTRNA